MYRTKKYRMLVQIAIVLSCLAISEVSAKTIIAAVGDSITSGYSEIENANGRRAYGGYAQYLDPLLNDNGWSSAVYNYGIAGDRAEWATVPSSRRGSNQIPNALQRSNPEYFLYLYGTNDLFHHSPETVVSYILHGVNTMLDGGAIPIVGTLLPDTRTSSSNESKGIPHANALLRAKLGEMDVQIAELYYAASATSPVSAWDDLLRDGLHPGSSGRRLMARTWYDALLSSVEIQRRRRGAIPSYLLLLLE